MKKCFSPSRLLFWLFPLFVSQATHAQYSFDHWTTDNGLPQNNVRDIVQTRDGYLWLATLDGLVRFDGVRFTVFNKSNSPGIITNRFVMLFEDAQGDLWACTENAGLTRLHQGRFVTYTTEDGFTKGDLSPCGNCSSRAWTNGARHEKRPVPRSYLGLLTVLCGRSFGCHYRDTEVARQTLAMKGSC